MRHDSRIRARAEVQAADLGQAAARWQQLFHRIATNRSVAQAVGSGDTKRMNRLLAPLLFGCRSQGFGCDENGEHCWGTVTCCIFFGLRFCIIVTNPSPSQIVRLQKTAARFRALAERLATNELFTAKFMKALLSGNKGRLTALLRVIELGPCRVIVDPDRVTICCDISPARMICLVIFRPSPR
jgi:hypothetical protein